MNNLPLDQILQGDCIKILRGFPESSIDLIFADPPYNLQISKDLRRPNQSLVSAVKDDWDKFTSFYEYDEFTHQWISACRRVLKDNGTFWVIGTYHNIFRVGTILQDLGFWILNDIIWLKSNPMPNFRGVRFTNAHETIIWAQKHKGKKYTFNHQAMKSLNDDLQMRSDWKIPLCYGKERIRKNGEKAHSAQKPEALLYRVIISSTNVGDVILDPFFGSGTTGAVAHKLGRHFIGIEKDKKYIALAGERIAATAPTSDDSLKLHEPRRSERIPFGSILESGLLSPGQMLFFAQNPSITAIVLANGQIRCGKTIASIHSTAKALSENKPVNGWDAWLCDFKGERVPLDTLRQILQGIIQYDSLKNSP